MNPTNGSHEGASLVSIDLDVEGMTCASCAARIERQLNKLPGVQATVNYATERAHVDMAPDRSVADLLIAVESAGYHARQRLNLPAGHDSAIQAPPDSAHLLGNRLAICAALTVPVIAMDMIPALEFTYWQWLSLTLAAPVAIWGAWPFHRAAWTNARHGTATMDTLVSVGVLAALAWSVWALFVGGAGAPGMKMAFTWRPTDQPQIYLEVAAGVTCFLLTGRYLEARAKASATEAIRSLLALGAKSVTVLHNGTRTTIPIDELTIGMRFVVTAGEKIATDGVVVEGRSAVDSSLVTGEPVPIDVGPGDKVVGATLAVDGALVVQATAVGADTELAQIAALVELAQTGKAQVQRLADAVSRIFVPIVLGISMVTALGWLLTGHGPQQAFTAAVAVLIIACPCALGLATPTALMVGTGRGAQLGIIIKGPQALEMTRRIDTVVLDKTGTITTGRMVVQRVQVMPGFDEALVLQAAAVLEQRSSHPMARAVVAYAPVDSAAEVSDFVSHAGFGVSGTVDGTVVKVGQPGWLAEQGIDVGAWSDDDRSLACVALDGRLAARLAIGDAIRPDSTAEIARLHGMGLRTALLTGDASGPAGQIAALAGIDDVVAQVSPIGKLQHVRALQEQGHTVAMVGDGINDAAALAQADLGIAMGAGTDVAIAASDITLMRDGIGSVADAIALSRRTLATIRGNLFWAFAYNLAAIPLAVCGLLNPLIAGAAMAFSSVFVVTNSLRLRRFRPGARA